ncbi:hypothetical protein CIG75_10595 [Tumebacillus algifaecis]|uniref:Uncharacterized protein n=1 Tax=Tumebacillus algifaecis TaxID=1214604 RepID=A0A223D1Y5_9BACL|nr:hypothetical protein CIG75_10595 [Tumebacillus algifaecis]
MAFFDEVFRSQSFTEFSSMLQSVKKPVGHEADRLLVCKTKTEMFYFDILSGENGPFPSIIAQVFD